MPPEDVSRSDRTQVARALECQIRERTSGRVHPLTVEVGDDRILVRGLSPSYHVKQLALLGVREVVAACPAVPVELDIRVHHPRASA
jgi:hypothetical protein